MKTLQIYHFATAFLTYNLHLIRILLYYKFRLYFVKSAATERHQSRISFAFEELIQSYQESVLLQ